MMWNQKMTKFCEILKFLIFSIFKLFFTKNGLFLWVLKGSKMTFSQDVSGWNGLKMTGSG